LVTPLGEQKLHTSALMQANSRFSMHDIGQYSVGESDVSS